MIKTGIRDFSGENCGTFAFSGKNCCEFDVDDISVRNKTRVPSFSTHSPIGLDFAD